MTEPTPLYAIEYQLSRTDLPRIAHGQKLNIVGTRRHSQHATAGTVIGYALETGHDPVASLDNARAKGHPIRWINLDAVIITAHRREEPPRTSLALDDVIWLEGCLCKIEPAANFNFTPRPLTEDEVRALHAELLG